MSLHIRNLLYEGGKRIRNLNKMQKIKFYAWKAIVLKVAL